MKLSYTVQRMNVADVLKENLKVSLRLSFDDGSVVVCRVWNVDDREHDDAFAEFESMLEGQSKPHLVPGAHLRFSLSEITRIMEGEQVLYERRP